MSRQAPRRPGVKEPDHELPNKDDQREPGPQPYQRPGYLVRYLAAGTFAGMGAAAAEMLIFFAPGRAPVPPGLIEAALLTCGLYCGAGLLLSSALWLSYLLALRFFAGAISESLPQEGPAWSVRAALTVRAVAGLLCLIGLSLSVGKLLDSVAPIPTPLRRAVVTSAGSGLVSAAWLLIYQALLRHHAALRRLAETLRWLMVATALGLVVVTAAVVWRSPFNQLAYLALMLEAFVVPIGLMAASQTLKKTSWSIPVAAFGIAIVPTGLWFGPTNQALYSLRTARALPAVVLRELPQVRWRAEPADLSAAIDRRFQRDPWGNLDVSKPAASPTDYGQPQPDIILISVDTLRRDRVFDPSKRDVMPHLQKFASTATSFTRAFAGAGATVQSLTQLMTGQREHTLAHLVAAPGAIAVLDPTTPTVASRLRRGGYWAEGFAGSGLFRDFPSLAIGFDRVHEFDSETHAGLTASSAFRELASALERTPEPAFLWAHVMEVHDYYKRGQQLARLYDEVANEVDLELGRLFEKLQGTDRGRRALIVITSDHGEGLGEARAVAHGFCHPLILPVPLIIRFPERPASSIEITVGHVDVATTILGSAGLPTHEVQGRDLRSLASSGEWPSDHVLFEHSTYGASINVNEVGVAAYPWLYSYDARLGIPILTNLHSDPVGLHNLAGNGLMQEAALRKLLLQSLSSTN